MILTLHDVTHLKGDLWSVTSIHLELLPHIILIILE